MNIFTKRRDGQTESKLKETAASREAVFNITANIAKQRDDKQQTICSAPQWLI